MISLILYGRNDAHGYNLHRRAALSLNCLAEVLTDPDDEIVFVDYNTPDGLPTFVEALADTLTARCLERLRVLRVPPVLHQQRFAALTHLPAVEPVCRNVAARRANPANRWLLSTNTDMILLPLSRASVSDVCRELPDGYYGLPRFELPEWLWERLPRTDPQHAMTTLASLGPRLRLDEPTLSHEWIRFDAPGDFQLVLRNDLLAIDGFDEEMVLGWHVDSNLARRMFLHRGSVGSLGNEVAGYHCNHSRLPTVYHHGGVMTQNEFDHFFTSVEHAGLPEQRETWGLADTDIEEVDLRGRIGLGLADALIDAIPPLGGAPVGSIVEEADRTITYDSGHVLPFVADSIAISPVPTTVAYLGANPVLREMLERFVKVLAPNGSLEVITLANERSLDALAESADLFVVDFGLEQSTASEADRNAHGGATVRFPEGLRAARTALERVVELERGRLERGDHPRRFVLINSGTAFVNDYVVAQLDCGYSTPHSRVRRATVKRVPQADEVTRRKQAQAARLVGWAARSDAVDDRLRIGRGQTVDLGELEDFSGFGEGWAPPDLTSIWTRGTRAELRLALDGEPSGRHDLEISFGRVGVGASELLEVSLLIDGAHVATRSFPGGTHRRTWRALIPPQALANREIDVALQIEEPGAWLIDERRLGVHVDSLAVKRGGVRHRWRDRISSRLRRPPP